MKLKTIVIWFLILMTFIVLLLTYLSFNDGQKCVSNPFVYGADKLSSEETGNLFCSCSFSNPNYAPFYFNKENVSLSQK